LPERHPEKRSYMDIPLLLIIFTMTFVVLTWEVNHGKYHYPA
jgi:hypothetical protein